MKILTNLLLLILMLSGPVYAKDNQSSLEKALQDEISGDSNKGKPDNPGEHGRDNAAKKQRENPGHGSKGDDSWESAISDAFDDEDKNDNKNKGKNAK